MKTSFIKPYSNPELLANIETSTLKLRIKTASATTRLRCSRH